ncbi:MAG: restriction endonuclease [Chloroflexi bacterium]|nr:restriction endonuclease [Chloroflexota bacterium]
MGRKSILAQWGITGKELTELVDQNPSLRGILLGYVAEKKFQDNYLSHPGITSVQKDDDHVRSMKGDRRIVYKGQTFLIEVKSLQTNMVRNLGNDRWQGKAQVDASDSRTITLPDGTTMKTTCLLRGEFDILAVNCFAFGEKWRFAFALNADLPPNTFKKYTEYQRRYLLPSLIPIEWPLNPPFTDKLIKLLKRLVKRSS